MSGWCNVMTGECMAFCVQVGGWTVASECCLCSGDSTLRIKCAAFRNKVRRFGSTSRTQTAEWKIRLHMHTCSANVGLLGIKSILNRVQVWLPEKIKLKSNIKLSHLQFYTCLTCVGLVWVFWSTHRIWRWRAYWEDCHSLARLVHVNKQCFFMSVGNLESAAHLGCQSLNGENGVNIARIHFLNSFAAK